MLETGLLRGQLRAPPWLLVVISVVGICLGVLGERGLYFLAGLVLLLFLLLRPGAFLVVAVTGYALGQGLFATRLVSLGFIETNVSQLALASISSLLLFRVLAGVVLGRPLPRLPMTLGLAAAFALYSLLALGIGTGLGGVSEAIRLLSCTLALFFGIYFGTYYPQAVRYCLASSALVIALSAAVEAVTGRGITEAVAVGAFRAAGSLGGPVVTATVIFAGLPALIELAIGERSVTRQGARNAVWIIASGFAVFGIVSTISRTVIVGLGLFAALAFVLGPSKRMSRLKISLIVGLLLVVMAGSILLLPQEYVEARTQDLPGVSVGGAAPNTGSGRFMIWTTVLQSLGETGVLGLTFGHGMGAVPALTATKLWFPFVSHNAFIETLYNLGVVGLLIFVLFNASVIRQLSLARRRGGSLGFVSGIWLAYFLSYLASTQMFNTFVFNAGPQWFTFLGIGYVLARIQVHESSEINDSYREDKKATQ